MCREAGMRIWVQLLKRRALSEVVPIKIGRAKNVKNSARFRTTLDFDRDDLWKESGNRQSKTTIPQAFDGKKIGEFYSSSTLSTCRHSTCRPSVDRTFCMSVVSKKLNMYRRHVAWIGCTSPVSGVENRRLSTCIRKLNVFNFGIHVESRRFSKALHVAFYTQNSTCRQCGLGISPLTKSYRRWFWPIQN